MTNERIIKLLENIDRKIGALLIATVLKEDSTEEKIRTLCTAGLKSNEIGSLIGMTGRGVRKNKAYKEIK